MGRLFKLYQFWLGIGLLLLTLFLGWGLPLIVPSTPDNGIFITIGGVIISAPFFIWSYVLYRRQIKSHEKSSPLQNVQANKTIIKNTKVTLDAEKVDKATGMNIDNVQAEISNLQIDVKAKDVSEATGLNVTARNTKFALSSKVIMCSCGYAISSITTCGYEPMVKCPQCGKEYNISPQR